MVVNYHLPDRVRANRPMYWLAVLGIILTLCLVTGYLVEAGLDTLVVNWQSNSAQTSTPDSPNLDADTDDVLIVFFTTTTLIGLVMSVAIPRLFCCNHHYQPLLQPPQSF